jgi:hypothetical protein
MIDPTSNRLSDLPLWRLLVALHDTERVAGAASDGARYLADEIARRGATPPADKTPKREGDDDDDSRPCAAGEFGEPLTRPDPSDGR